MGACELARAVLQADISLPAEHATIRLPDYLLTRLSNDDNMAKSLSTFALEMTTSAIILGMATSRSLILIDEVEYTTGFN